MNLLNIINKWCLSILKLFDVGKGIFLRKKERTKRPHNNCGFFYPKQYDMNAEIIGCMYDRIRVSQLNQFRKPRRGKFFLHRMKKMLSAEVSTTSVCLQGCELNVVQVLQQAAEQVKMLQRGKSWIHKRLLSSVMCFILLYSVLLFYHRMCWSAIVYPSKKHIFYTKSS